MCDKEQSGIYWQSPAKLHFKLFLPPTTTTIQSVVVAVGLSSWVVSIESPILPDSIVPYDFVVYNLQSRLRPESICYSVIHCLSIDIQSTDQWMVN